MDPGQAGRCLETDWPGLARQAEALLHDESDPVANAANLSALLFEALEDVNWVGFYFLKDGELVVGPFQGKPACVRIALGAGVCGTAAQLRNPVRVADVHEFGGHIACDPVSRSEMVVPLICADKLVGVLDFDSPTPGRFSAADEIGAIALASIYCAAIS